MQAQRDRAAIVPFAWAVRAARCGLVVVGLGVLAGCMLTPTSRVAPGDSISWDIEVENHSRQPYAVYWAEESEDGGRGGGMESPPCTALGGGMNSIEATAPFTVHVVEGPLENQPGDLKDLPVVLRSDALSPPPGAVGYRIVVDDTGGVSVVPIATRNPVTERALC